MTQILSIQSAVAYGFAGNSAAVFPLRRAGVDVWPVLTVNFSNHTGYGATRGPLIPASDIWEVVQGVDDRGVLAQCDAVLTGYQGSQEVGDVVLRAVELTKQRNPDAIYCCDPVMGDVGRGFFVRPGIPEFFRDHVVAAADLMTPNLFELRYLTGRETHTIEDVIDAANELRAKGPEAVLVTSVIEDDSTDDVMRMLLVTGDGVWQVETPMIDHVFVGSGDLTAAMFLAHWLRTRDAEETLSACASIVYSVLKATHDLGRAELALVQAQDCIVEPPHTFRATRLR